MDKILNGSTEKNLGVTVKLILWQNNDIFRFIPTQSTLMFSNAFVS